VLNNTTLSAKQYYHLLDELIKVDRLFGDVKFAKILFSSDLQGNNDEYCDEWGEPLAQTLLYEVDKLSNKMVYELFMDKQSKINFKKENINCDNILGTLIDSSFKLTEEQFTELTKLFVFNKKIDVYNVNDFGKTPLELFLYRKRTNKNVFEILIKKFYLDEKKKIEINVQEKICNYLEYTDNEFFKLKGIENSTNRFKIIEKKYNELFN